MPTIVYLDTLPAQNGLDILYSQSKVEILKIFLIVYKAFFIVTHYTLTRIRVIILINL